MKFVLGLGTNLGERENNLRLAVAALRALPKTRVIKLSRVYETSPVGYDGQGDFLNCAALLESSLTPHEMLGACLGAEAAMGRVRTIKNGPRVIDIDLLFAQDEKISSPNLTLPHPQIKNRLFVLLPLFDLFEDKTVFGFDLSGAAEKITDQQIKETKLRL